MWLHLNNILPASYNNFCFTSQDDATHPSLMIVYFGGNDFIGPHSSGLGPHVPLQEYIANTRKILVHNEVLLLYRSHYVFLHYCSLNIGDRYHHFQTHLILQWQILCKSFDLKPSNVLAYIFHYLSSLKLFRCAQYNSVLNSETWFYLSSFFSLWFIDL